MSDAPYTRNRSDTDTQVESSNYTWESWKIGQHPPYNSWDLYYQKIVPSSGTFGDASTAISRNMTDVVVPRFKTRSAKGEIFNNPMTRQVQEVYESLSVFDHARLAYTTPFGQDPPEGAPWFRDGIKFFGTAPANKWIGTFQSYGDNAPSTPTVDIEHLKQLAVTRAHANIDFSEVHILETLAEMTDTVRFLKDAFKNAIKIGRKIRDKEFLFLAKKLDEEHLEEVYMEARYGLRPLIYDVRDICSALMHSKTFDRYTFRAEENADDVNTFSETDTSDSAVDLDVDVTVSRSVKVRAGVLVSLDSLSTLKIWGLDKPFEAIWEVVPFSFVFDWFFNIGQTIASLTPEIGAKQLASWVTIDDVIDSRVEVVGSWSSIIDDYYNLANYFNVSNCHRGQKISTYERIPDPRLSLFPTYKIRLDELKILDLAIITKGLFSRDREKRLRIAKYGRR